MVDIASDDISTLRNWIVEKQKESVTIDLDTDLIEDRLIDSLQFAEFLFLLEELSGKQIDLSEIELDWFRTLRSIQEHFLLGEQTACQTPRSA